MKDGVAKVLILSVDSSPTTSATYEKPVEVDESHNPSHNTTQSKSISTSKQDRSI
jgi:hypothetical protein